MASHAHTTGAPARASVIPFPMSAERRFRVELAHCHSSRMVDRCLARVQRVDSGLTQDEYTGLAVTGLERGRALREAEAR